MLEAPIMEHDVMFTLFSVYSFANWCESQKTSFANSFIIFKVLTEL